MGSRQLAVQVGIELLEQLAVGSNQIVAILEAQLLGLVVKLHSHLACGDVGLAPGEEDHRVDEQGQEEVDEHAANHDEQSLPGRLRAELPGLFGLLHLLGVEALVDHAGNLAVAAQRQPAHAVLGVAFLRFETEQLAPPLTDGDVEEEVELLDPYAEEL